MKRKEYKDGAEVRQSIINVAEQIRERVGNTLGPGGRDYMTPAGITNDGKSIIEHIRFQNECEDNLALAFHEIAQRTDKKAGDGTTTATVIGTTLAITVLPKVPNLDVPHAEHTVMQLSHRLEEEKDKALTILEKHTQKVETLEQLQMVARTSMENNEVADMIAGVMHEAGPHSFTAIDEGFTGKVESARVRGIELPMKTAAQFMMNKGNYAEYKGQIPVLVANHLFEDYREVRNFMESMLEFSQKNRTTPPVIVILGRQFSIPFVQTVGNIWNQSGGKVNVLLLSTVHVSGPDAEDIFGDAAAFCGAGLIDTTPRGTQKITDARFEKHCGLVGKIVATEKGVVLFDGKGTTLGKDPTTPVEHRVMEINKVMEEEKSPSIREKLERRIAELRGGKATIYVDAPTATEKYYIKLKVQDCLNSCKAALEGGMIPGGGVTLRAVAEELGTDSLLYEALSEPYNRIQKNAGGELALEPEVKDAFIVAKAGIESAVSVIKEVIRIEGVMADVVPSMVESLAEAVNGQV